MHDSKCNLRDCNSLSQSCLMCHVPSRMGFCGQEAKLKRVSEMELIQKLYERMCHEFDFASWQRNYSEEAVRRKKAEAKQKKSAPDSEDGRAPIIEYDYATPGLSTYKPSALRD